MHELGKLAILCTGGIDSTILLCKYAKYKPIPITVNYGQYAFTKQVELLQYHIKKLKLPDLVTIDVHLHDWQKTGGLFTPGYIPNENNPLEDWDDLRYQDFFVEGRNMLMVGYALAYCSSKKIDTLYAGYLYGKEEWQNRRSYKLMTGDNSPQFVDMMNLLAGVGLSHQVRFQAPFYEARMDKAAVIELGKTLGINFAYTYSCYFVPACGICDNCLLRKKLLENE